MNLNKKFVIGFSVLIAVAFFATSVSAALTFNSTSVISGGALTLTGSGASVWDIGNNTLSIQTVNNGAVSIGGNTSISGTLGLAQGNSSIVIGSTTGNSRNTYAIDIQSLHESNDQVASAQFSIALGSSNKASNTYAMAIGRLNEATNFYNTAVGYDNTVSGLYGTVIGYQNESEGQFGLAIGYQNTANMNGSIAIGNGLTTDYENSMVIGPSDAAKMMIRSNGFVGIGTTLPDANLQVGNPGNSTSEYAQMDAIDGAPSSGDCNTNSGRGRMIYDYTNHRLYICDGVANGWNYITTTD